MKQLVQQLTAWVKTLPWPLNGLVVIFGIEIAVLVVFFAFAFLMFILWVIAHPYLWPNG